MLSRWYLLDCRLWGVHASLGEAEKQEGKHCQNLHHGAECLWTLDPVPMTDGRTLDIRKRCDIHQASRSQQTQLDGIAAVLVHNTMISRIPLSIMSCVCLIVTLVVISTPETHAWMQTSRYEAAAGFHALPCSCSLPYSSLTPLYIVQDHPTHYYSPTIRSPPNSRKPT